MSSSAFCHRYSSLLFLKLSTYFSTSSVVVKALRYQSKGPGIDPRWYHWGFFPWYPRQNHVP